MVNWAVIAYKNGLCSHHFLQEELGCSGTECWCQSIILGRRQEFPIPDRGPSSQGSHLTAPPLSCLGLKVEGVEQAREGASPETQLVPQAAPFGPLRLQPHLPLSSDMRSKTSHRSWSPFPGEGLSASCSCAPHKPSLEVPTSFLPWVRAGGGGGGTDLPPSQEGSAWPRAVLLLPS